MHVFFRAKLESDLVMFSFFAAELTEQRLTANYLRPKSDKQ